MVEYVFCSCSKTTFSDYHLLSFHRGHIDTKKTYQLTALPPRLRTLRVGVVIAPMFSSALYGGRSTLLEEVKRSSLQYLTRSRRRLYAYHLVIRKWVTEYVIANTFANCKQRIWSWNIVQLSADLWKYGKTERRVTKLHLIDSR